MLPDLGHALRQVGPAGADHLVGDLDKQGGHPLRRVVELGEDMDHADIGHQSGDVFQHTALSGGDRVIQEGGEDGKSVNKRERVKQELKMGDSRA